MIDSLVTQVGRLASRPQGRAARWTCNPVGFFQELKAQGLDGTKQRLDGLVLSLRGKGFLWKPAGKHP